FQAYGIDIDALEPGEAAARIGRTGIRQALVKALDEWGTLCRRASGYRHANDPELRSWKKLVEVARQVDSDVWRNQFREVLLRKEWTQETRQDLEKLADAVPVRDVSPATLHLLGTSLMDLGAPEKAIRVLRQAR